MVLKNSLLEMSSTVDCGTMVELSNSEFQVSHQATDPSIPSQYYNYIVWIATFLFSSFRCLFSILASSTHAYSPVGMRHKKSWNDSAVI